MVDRLRRFGRGAGVERELGELLLDAWRDCRRSSRRSGGRRRAARSAPRRAPCSSTSWPASRASGAIAGEGQRRGRGERELQQLRGGLEAAGDQHDRIARRRRRRAGPRPPAPSRRRPARPGSSARRRTSRSTPPRRRAGPGSPRRSAPLEIDPLGFRRPSPRRAGRASARLPASSGPWRRKKRVSPGAFSAFSICGRFAFIARRGRAARAGGRRATHRARCARRSGRRR